MFPMRARHVCCVNGLHHQFTGTPYHWLRGPYKPVHTDPPDKALRNALTPGSCPAPYDSVDWPLPVEAKWLTPSAGGQETAGASFTNHDKPATGSARARGTLAQPQTYPKANLTVCKIQRAYAIPRSTAGLALLPRRPVFAVDSHSRCADR